jgi:hypothetical protein
VALYGNERAISNISASVSQKNISFEIMKMFACYEEQNKECCLDLLVLTAGVKDKTGTGYQNTSFSVMTDHTISELGEQIMQKMSHLFDSAETILEESSKDVFTFTIHFTDEPDLDEDNPQKIRFFIFKKRNGVVEIKFVTIVSPKSNDVHCMSFISNNKSEETRGPETGWEYALEKIWEEYSDKISNVLIELFKLEDIEVLNGPVYERPREKR